MRLGDETAAIFLTKIEWLVSITVGTFDWLQSITWGIFRSCVVTFVFQLDLMQEKTMPKEVDNNAFVVSNNNESQVPSKNTKFLDSFTYTIYFKKI